MARLGRAWLGSARQGKDRGQARLGKDRGTARLGRAWLGSARQGMVTNGQTT